MIPMQKHPVIAWINEDYLAISSFKDVSYLLSQPIMALVNDNILLKIVPLFNNNHLTHKIIIKMTCTFRLL